MIMDRLGKLFEERRKRNEKVDVERRKEDINKKKEYTKTSNKTKK